MGKFYVTSDVVCTLSNNNFCRPFPYSELDARDMSRNIIEKIFQKASLNPSKPSSKIKSILRVKNSMQTLERFDKYREKVKRMANEKNIVMHPRSKVDGNELLRFFGTTIACRSGKSKGVSELCTDSSCRVCSLLQSNFNTEYTLKNGIQLSTSSEVFSEKISLIERMQKIKRAVIVCRIIAGNMTDTNFEEYNQFGDKGPNSHSEHLILQNPSAVLPCFVVVFV